MGSVEVRQASIRDLDFLAGLFDGYRQFYGAKPDLPGAREFLLARFAGLESVVFLAFVDGVAAGFTQLYPSFSSVSMRRIFILNDLFVARAGRRSGAGAALLEAAAEFGRRAGAVRLALSTALDNTVAQSLYEKQGWVRDSVYCSYELTL